MTAGPDTGPGVGVPVLVCPSCDGLTFTLDPCRCLQGGDRLLIDTDAAGADTAYRDCLVCQGAGTAARACHDCGQTGRRRAQVVLTMANLDTGQVASTSVVPGVVEPEPSPDGGGWHLPVASLVRELAAQVGVKSWRDVHSPPWYPVDPVISLPPDWAPNLPEAARHALEAEAIASRCHQPWQVFLGRTSPEPPADPGRQLGRLCWLADLLCLDLVVEARRGSSHSGLCWTIRYEMPGAPVPVQLHNQHDDLLAAIAATGVADAMYGLAERGRHAPAHYLRASQQPVPEPTVTDVDQLERRIVAECVDSRTGAETAGGQAIWRDGRWWHSSLRVAGTSETLTEWETGQISRSDRPVLRRGWEPPEPSWWGGCIPYVPCPDCDPVSRLRRCLCRLGRPTPDPDCPRCAGSGRSPSALPCHTCRDSHRVYRGMAITITDLVSPPVQLNWWAGDRVSAPLVATQPGGKPVHQLPEQFRLAAWANHFGVRPEDLTLLDGGDPLDQNLRDGIVTCDYPGQAPLPRHIARASAGQPGGRLLLAATALDVPPMSDVIRLVLGLHLAVTVTVTDHRPNHDDPRLIHGESWDVTVVAPEAPVTPANPPTRSTPEAAIRHCLDYFDLAVAGTVPADPHRPIPVPQTPVAGTFDDPVPLIRRLARRYAGQPVAVHFARTGCQLHLRQGRDDLRHLATATTLAAALRALGLPPE